MKGPTPVPNGINLIGRRVKIINRNSSSHNIPMGTVVKVTRSGGAANLWYADGYGNNFYSHECELVPETKEEIKTDIAELESKITVARAKLEFLEEIGSKEYSETEFKTYQTLERLWRIINCPVVKSQG